MEKITFGMEKVSDLPNGQELYRVKNGNGFTYYSTETANGIFVWDTRLVSAETLLAAIVDFFRRIKVDAEKVYHKES